MALPRMPDLSTGNFLVQIDGYEVMSLTAVAGLGFEVQVLEDPENRGSGAQAAHRAPGVNKVTTVTLSTMELEKAALLGTWRNEIENGQINRKNASIIMRDAASLPVMQFDLVEAWPSAIAINSVPQAGEGWIQIDVTLAHEGLTRKVF
jgi:phage tail-like protein